MYTCAMDELFCCKIVLMEVRDKYIATIAYKLSHKMLKRHSNSRKMLKDQNKQEIKMI